MLGRFCYIGLSTFFLCTRLRTCLCPLAISLSWVSRSSQVVLLVVVVLVLVVVVVTCRVLLLSGRLSANELVRFIYCCSSFRLTETKVVRKGESFLLDYDKKNEHSNLEEILAIFFQLIALRWVDNTRVQMGSQRPDVRCVSVSCHSYH